MLASHADLDPQFAYTCADALQRAIDGPPPRMDRNPDVILRHAVCYTHGADKKTWEALLRKLREGVQIPANPPYVAEGSFIARHGLYRDTKTVARDKVPLLTDLAAHRDFIEMDPDGMLLDFLAEEGIPNGVRLQLLRNLQLDYDPDRSTPLHQHGIPWSLAGEASTAIDVTKYTDLLRAMASSLFHRKLGNAETLRLFNEYLLFFSVHALSQHTHYRDQWETLTNALVATSDQEELKMSQLRPIYEAVSQILIHGLPDYPLEDFLAPIKTHLATLSAELKASVPLQNATTLRQLHQALAPHLRGIPGGTWHRTTKGLMETYDQWLRKMRTLGKFFEEQIDDTERHEVFIVPVVGLAAGFAIDSGSDCGQGEQTGRILYEHYMVNLLTNRDHTTLGGYFGYFTVTSTPGTMLCVDAINHDTAQSYAGVDLLQGVRDHLRQLTGTDCRGVLISRSGRTASNIDAIIRAVEAI